MWIMTTAGFFSAVEDSTDPEKNHVVVRARKLEDLVNLSSYLTDAHDITASEKSDYRFRIRITKQEWSDAVAKIADDIDYSNFKARVWEIDKNRANLYGDVWAILYSLQRDEVK